MRIAYSELHTTVPNNSDPEGFTPILDNHLYPNLFSVPYPSSIHWRKDAGPPWKLHEPREHGMLFVGNVNGDYPVRSQIEKQCLSYSNKRMNQYVRKCTMITNSTKELQMVPDQIRQSTRATFCLNPGGDTPDRKGISDAIASGCIPVFFSKHSAVGWSWFWSSWKDAAHIMVPREEFVKGNIHLHTLLHTTMPPSLVEIMQETLYKRGREFQYSIDEDIDGLRILLNNLKAEAERKIDLGICS
mmetsp:Transcript_2278/g.4786  ORF Transcript_2278/g.4786 Transcript_2278/m.4786 type:complete len:244 (+) Transcript_2278:912-1643(+)